MSLDESVFLCNESGTQTEKLWFTGYQCLDQTNMGTQTTNKIFENGHREPLLDKSVQIHFDEVPSDTLDKSVQLDNMISLDDSSDIVLTESSNISTQTYTEIGWLANSPICESSSTQTDFFDTFDFLDIDFEINARAGSKTNMETQTTIPLSDMLASPLETNYAPIVHIAENVTVPM